jgi:hypothetical protein
MSDQPIHVFEKAGLGRAPFRCVAVASLPSPSLAEANPEAYNNALRDLPRGIGLGSCHFCGTAIMHNFIIESADDRRFVVGCDCVGRTGDAGLIQQVKRVRVEDRLAKRNAARSLKKAEREAIWAAERAERAKTFAAEHAALIERAKVFFEASAFIQDVTEKGLAGRFISDRALEALTRSVTEMEEQARRRANSRHIGTVGKRETFKVTVERVASFERQSFSGFGRETVWIITMRDEATGSTLVSKTPSFSAQKGERMVIKATVKAHDEFRGELQTVVQRVAVVSMES